jgi:DNA-binding transcriptional MocR family regulator
MPISEASQPLSHRVYRRLAGEIESGELAPGARLRHERLVLRCARRQPGHRAAAIEELVVGGRVETRGRGSFATGEGSSSRRTR